MPLTTSATHPQRCERWLKFDYKDIDSNGYEVKIVDFKDDRLSLLSSLTREAELLQCARRIRETLCGKDKRIVLFTNIPVPDLPPSQLWTVSELADAWEIDLDWLDRSLKSVVKERAEMIVKEGMREAAERGVVFQTTVRGLLSSVLLGIPFGTEEYNLLWSNIPNRISLLLGYVREALMKLEESEG